ncbi:hypothetical protein [Burkholderia catarinensis]|uniref:hypothetical protein n=1 Tax=Burkholderia catarinensis TaxID=1108140 RepID=UPI0009159451|nr:hypothetical protein [Burkholderia catarinensis]KAG8153335.1 hypothetical protein BFF94_012320 [Burkholderia catarinensis]
MYSINLGLVRLDFEAAVIKVPCNGDYDWMTEEWIDTRQEIDIVQAVQSATVFGTTGRFAQNGPHLVEVLLPHLYVEKEVVAHLQSKPDTSQLPERIVRDAVKTDHYSWGKLISMDWGSLGYAPGGLEYCLLPIDGPAISIGFLRLDWTSVRIHRSS